MRCVSVAELGCPLLRSRLAWEQGDLLPTLAQADPAWVVVTMGVPASLYRRYLRAHSVKPQERNVLGSAGMSPVDQTLISRVEKLGENGARK